MGIHYCLGAPLARLKAQIVLETLLPRIKRVEVLDADAGALLRPGGPDAMQVRFELDRGRGRGFRAVVEPPAALAEEWVAGLPTRG